MTGPADTFGQKDTAITNIILNHLLSEREGLGLLAPTARTGLAAAAGDTASWFAGEEHFEDRIFDYLGQRCDHHLGKERWSWSLRLTYGRHLWPVGADPATVAREMVERLDLSAIVAAPALDYLGVGSAHGVLDASGTPVQISGAQPHQFGYAVVVAYATDGNGLIVERINRRREMLGAAPLLIAVPLREMARKYIHLPTTAEAEQSMSQDAQDHGYLTAGWQTRFGYGGAYARIPTVGGTPLLEAEMADALAAELLKDQGDMLLRMDWQEIGIATAIDNYAELGGWHANAEFILGWRIPFGAERPAHFPPPIYAPNGPSSAPDAAAQGSNASELEALLGPVYQEPPPQPRRRTWWPFRPRA